jgi:hypothetical protein
LFGHLHILYRNRPLMHGFDWLMMGT